MVKGNNFSVVRQRITPEIMINYEKFPDWYT